MLNTAMAAAGPKVLVQVGDRLGQPGVMGCEHRPTGGPVTEAVEDRDALVGRRTTSKAGTALRPWGRPNSSPVVGWRPSNVAWNPAGDASPCSPGCRRRRSTTVLGTRRGPTGTPRGRWPARGCSTPPPYREHGDVGHHPPLPSRRRWRQERTLGALLLGRPRVGPGANGEASSVMAATADGATRSGWTCQ
jgi:hypothetical protein